MSDVQPDPSADAPSDVQDQSADAPAGPAPASDLAADPRPALTINMVQWSQTAAQDMQAVTGIRFDATQQERTYDAGDARRGKARQEMSECALTLNRLLTPSVMMREAIEYIEASLAACPLSVEADGDGGLDILQITRDIARSDSSP